MKLSLVRRASLMMIMMSGTLMQLSCGLTQRDYSNIAQTALTTTLTSALQSLLTGLISGGTTS